MAFDLYTVGHSTHTAGHLLELLNRHGITAVADVRSHPYSRYNPQFKKRVISRSLDEAGVAYVFLGKELGARSRNPDCYRDGKVRYDRLASEPLFQRGVDRLMAGMSRYRIALMCAEQDPVTCHRMILVCRQLRAAVDSIAHILADGSLEPNEESERRLMRLHGLAPDMLQDEKDCIEQAYDRQADKIAYVDPDMKSRGPASRGR